jgi:glutamine cyclotransferase
MKKALGLLIALGAMSLMSVSAYAATYSVSGTASDGIVTVTLKAAPDANTDSVNGYALNVSYDSSVLTPVGLTDSNGDAVTDATGAQLYAENELDDGVFVASEATVDGESVIAVAWADSSAVTLDADGTELATLTFTVNDGVTATSTDLGVIVKADASSSTDLVAHSSEEVATGTVTLSADVLYGDVDNDGEVTGADAAFVAQHAAKTITLESKYLTAADVDNDGEVTGADAAYIAQYAAKTISAFPVESK